MNLLNKITSLNNKAPIQLTRFIRYSISGTICGLTDLALLYIITEYFGIFYAISAIISFVIAHTINFTINKNWGFKDSKTSIERGLSLFLGFGLASAILIPIFLTILVELAGLNYLIAKIILIIIFGIINFTLNYTITFKKEKELEKLFKKR